MSGETVNKRCIESLIKAGAFDEFGYTRATLLASFENILDTINNSNKRSYQGQVTMFDLSNTDDNLEDIKYTFINLPELNERELLSLEKEMLGIYITGHPLDKLRTEIEKITNINTLEINEANQASTDEISQNKNNYMSANNIDGKQVKFAGIISSVKKKYTKRNTIMAFITVEDLYGSIEVIVFDSCYSKCSDTLLVDDIVAIEGKLSLREDEEAKIVANNIVEINEYIKKANTINKIDETERIASPKTLIIDITNMEESTKTKLRGAIKFFSGDKNNIAIKVKDDDKLLSCGAIYLTEKILQEFKEIVGENRIKLI